MALEIMELTLMIVTSALVVISVKWLVSFVQMCRALPPGPWGVPVLGYLPWITGKPYEKFSEIAKKYGNVFSVTMGCDTMVVLNDWPSIKQSLVDQPQIFSGRPQHQMTMALSKNKNIAFTDGPVWQKQRNIFTRCLKSMGMGKKSMEGLTMNIVHEVMEQLEKNDGNLLEMQTLFFGPIFRATWSQVDSDTNISETTLKEFESTIGHLFQGIGPNNLINLLPWLRFVPPNGFGYWQLLRTNEKVLSFLKNIIDKHLVNWNEGSLHDFVDLYLAEIKAKETSKITVEPPYDVEHLLMSLWDMFMAGVDTTNMTCLWGLLYLSYHPEVQKKAQNELDDVIGRHRLPTLDDVSRLPYLQALLMEIHRKCSLAPLSVPHKTMKQAIINGVSIPKGTTCLQNIYAVHHEPTLWDQPEMFMPERFITEDGIAQAPPYLMPFSVGPRICLGQAIAEMELKLVFSCLLHQFNFAFPSNRPKPSLEPVVRLNLQPQPFSLLIQTRKS